MFSFILFTIVIISTVQGAASSLKNTAWPLYATLDTTITTYTDLNDYGYACVRNYYLWAFPQKTTGSSPKTVTATGKTGQAVFYR